MCDVDNTGRVTSRRTEAFYLLASCCSLPLSCWTLPIVEYTGKHLLGRSYFTISSTYRWLAVAYLQ